ncbi:hypothetical protein CEXT_610251 [Caerostris extrusa]|uniref:Uncharacterized protein n=1 Tax=Caerostris extrusa TaxID=172846 RepID=A0AAV4Y000_CAEEX|nr:hypothetical protein CEXT_610251 [Caerostris extrusa]
MPMTKRKKTNGIGIGTKKGTDSSQNQGATYFSIKKYAQSSRSPVKSEDGSPDLGMRMVVELFQSSGINLNWMQQLNILVRTVSRGSSDLSDYKLIALGQVPCFHTTGRQSLPQPRTRGD